MSETIKLLDSAKKLVGKTNNGETLSNLEVVELVLLQRNLAENQYQQKLVVLFSFISNKSLPIVWNVEPNNLVF